MKNFAKPWIHTQKPFLFYLASILMAIIASLSGLITPSVEGLDSSHNVMDGFFFYDLFRKDLWSFESIGDIVEYPHDYHSQYPALGFIYWPPFWPIIESLFFYLMGPSLFSAQLSVLCFNIVFAVSFVAIVSRLTSKSMAIFGLIAVFSIAQIWLSANSIMRDMPALAMMTLSFWVFIRWIESEYQTKWITLLVLCLTLGLYTKHTTGLVILAMATAMLFKPAVLKRKSSIIAIIHLAILAAPLVVFTATVGQSNLAQSFGNGTNTIMSDYHGPQRWHIESWVYYPQWLLKYAPGIGALAVMGVIAALRKGCSSEKHRLIIYGLLSWLVLFYVLFSYFDNKSYRFATLWVMPLAAFACIGAQAICESLWHSSQHTQHKAWAFIIIASLISLNATVSSKIPRMQAVDQTMETLLAIAQEIGETHCIYYQGHFKQVFVQALRRHDKSGLLHLQPLDTTAPLDTHQCRVIAIEESTLKSPLKDNLHRHYSSIRTEFKSPKLARPILVFYR